jgi:hypothetical protein
MKKLLFISLFISSLSFAQNYNTGIGLKGGSFGLGGLNVKHFVSNSSAFDITIGGGRNSLWLQGLYEIHNPISGGLNWYYGLGADLGFWNRNYAYNHPSNGKSYSGAWGGIDGVAGLEYVFSEIPLSVSAEAVPSIRLFPYVGFWWGGAFAIRYTIK